MNERKAFLKVLAENEDDTTARLVFADWLDEQGEHEEADRQRKWPAAKEWLVRFCQVNNPSSGDSEEWIITYEVLVELGREAVDGADKEGIGFSCGNNMDMCDALRADSEDFWKNWSIVTGVPVPADVAEKSYFICGC